MFADLHCHTTFSDGSVSIGDLVQLSKKAGLDTIAVTDHDCLDAIDRAKVAGKRMGINVIPGVELSSTDGDKEIHILAYMMESPDRLQGICHKNTLARKQAATYISVKLMQSYPVHNDLILGCAAGSKCVFKPHIMMSLMQAGYCTELYGDVYHKLFDANSPENVLIRTPKFPTPEEVIREIHDAGGIAILAHPTLYGDMSLVEKYIGYGLDGIEVWHPTASQEAIDTLLELAEKNNLLATGGSDFHGMFNREICTMGSCGMDETAFRELEVFNAKKQKAAKKAE